MSAEPPKVVVERHESYRTIVENGIFGGPRPGFFEWIVYTDETVADDALAAIPQPDISRVYIKRTLQCRIVTSPEEAKALAEWLNNNIKQYEKQFGKIRLPKAPQPGKKPSDMYV